MKMVVGKLTPVKRTDILKQRIHRAIKIELITVFFMASMVGTVSAEDSILKISNREILAENYEYAILSGAAYDTTYQDVFIDGSKYEVDRIFNDFEGDLSPYNIFRNWLSTSGLNATLYKNDDINEVVISFRGTELQPSDILEDVQLPFGNRQQELALEWVKQMIEEYPDYSVSLTGHSLGGGLAQYVSYYTGLDAVTYNAAHVPVTIRGENRDNVVSIYNNVDILGTSLQAENNQIGRKYLINIPLSSDAACITPFACHRMKYLLEATYIAVDELEGRTVDTTSSQYRYIPENIELNSAPEDVLTSSDLPFDLNSDLINETVTSLLSAANPTDPVSPTEPSEPTDPVDPIDPTEPVDPVIATNLSGNLSGVVSDNWRRNESFENQVIIDTGTDSISNIETVTLSTDYTFNRHEYEIPEEGFIYTNQVSISELALPGPYQHLTWGEWSSDNFVDDLSSGFPYFRSGVWVIGQKTTSDELAFKEGTATFSGDLIGSVSGSGSAERAGSGQIDIHVDFTSEDINGRFVFWENNKPNALSRVQVFDSEILSFGDGLGFNDGWTHWEIRGYFFGDDASEVGGTVRLGVNGFPDTYNSIDTVFDGVFIASNDGSGSSIPLFVSSGVYPSDFSDSKWSTSLKPYNVHGVDHTDNAFKDDYNYVSWGGWNTDGTSLKTVNDAAWNTNGFWSSSTATEANDLPRLGTATYSGDVLGISNTSELVSGDVTINANFAQDTVSSTMNLEMNGNNLGSFSGTGGINRNIQSSDTAGQNVSNGFDASLSGDNGFGLLQGKFAGPNAEEVLGSWGVDFSSGPIDGANGIFRAQN